MAKVKFVVAVVYKGERVAAHTPFNVTDEDVPALVKEGAIVIVAPYPKRVEPAVQDVAPVKEEVIESGAGEDAGQMTTPPPTPDPAADALERELAAIANMTVSELKEYASAHDINISGYTLKEDIRTAIEDALSFSE